MNKTPRNERIRNLNRDLQIRRDKAGVAHISAKSWHDALYGLGFAHARDRLTQILFSRTVASGRAAERIAGHKELVETDSFFRRMGLHQNLEKSASNFEPSTLDEINHYCEGLNDGIQATGRSLPMWVTGFQPRPWNVEAVLIVGKLLSFGGLAVSQMQNERLLIELIHAGADAQTLRHIFAPRLDNVDFDLLKKVHTSNQLSDSALDLLTDLPRLAGSNAWAVTSDKSATGSAMIASDPHLEINRLPAIWYEVVLDWQDNYVCGATLPGCPLFAVARTKTLAWGVTYMKGDTTDFFIEDCRRGPSGWQYRREHDWFDFQVRNESIERKGSDPKNLRVLENEQGILESDPDEFGDGLYLSVAWSGNFQDSSRAISTWLKLIGAKNTKEGMEVAKNCPQPTLCFIFADAEGHVGQQTCGTFPKRNDPTAGLLPLPAWDESNHWQGWISQDDLPNKYDPECGFVATANEAANPDGGRLLITQFLPDYRKRRIDERLNELSAVTLQDMKDLQYDLISLQARDLLSVFLPLMDDGPIREQLSNWNYAYSIDSREATLFQRLYINVLMEFCGQEQIMGWRRALYICTRAGYSTMVLAALDQMLMSDDSPIWKELDKGKVVRKAVERLKGFKPEPWGKKNNFQFINRFFDIKTVGRLLGFESRRIPMAGCHATPFQGHVFQTATREQTFAPSYHFVADLGTNEAHTNLPGGPSESRFSKHYQSDVNRWIKGEYKVIGPTTQPSE